MQSCIDSKTSWRVDYTSLCRPVSKLRKSRLIRCTLRKRFLSPAVSGRPSHLPPVSLKAKYSSLPATARDAPAPITSTPKQEKRTLGWAQTFRERFDLQDEILGEGSFGIVRPAVLKETGKTYAVKMLLKSAEGDWEKKSAMLQRECTHWKQLQDCQQVVHLEGVYEDDEYLYIVQELCKGGDIQHFLQDQGRLTEFEAAQIVTPILKMLAACHEKNICFGDVKPANFMLKKRYPCQRHLADPSAPRGDLIVKAIDFGCSQKISEDEKLKKRTGTPIYMAPEIFFGWYSVEVDIWAVGMMLYQLISGRLPFFGDHAEQLKKGPMFMIVQAVMETDLDFDGPEWDGISSELKDFITQLLDVDYNTRPSAKTALHHQWIRHYSRDNVIVKGPFGNIIKFPGKPGETVFRGSGDSHDGRDGLGNSN